MAERLGFEFRRRKPPTCAPGTRTRLGYATFPYFKMLQYNSFIVKKLTILPVFLYFPLFSCIFALVAPPPKQTVKEEALLGALRIQTVFQFFWILYVGCNLKFNFACAVTKGIFLDCHFLKSIAE